MKKIENWKTKMVDLILIVLAACMGYFLVMSLIVSWVFLSQLGFKNWSDIKIPKEKHGMTFRLYPNTNDMSSYIDYHEAKINVINQMPTIIVPLD